MRLSLLALALPVIVSASLQDQEILSPPSMVHELFMDTDFTPTFNARPRLTELLTIESSASIYYSYARETEFSKEFSSVDRQLTLLVPTNKAVMSLPRKPNQGPETAQLETEMSEQQYDERSKRYVQDWVAAHVIPSRVSFSDVPVTYNTMLDGKSITFTPAPGGGPSDWSKVTLEGGIHIIDMKEGENGVIYMIDRVIKSY